MDTLQAKTNETLDNFRETHSEAQQQFLVDRFVESGSIVTGEAFGVTEAQARVVEAGFVKTMERDVFSHYGLTHSDWMDHVDPADLPTFRRAAIKGDFSIFHQHAAQVAKARKDGSAFED
ncbi:hypothetical protein MES5069_230034 [Mesorhizobium escarrei]|uniref:Uncharacterized protein n=1 Tax=Mesorhizobium escarrei TaxID=666018 RepID=A0ABM9DSE9_9HYPH|nr:hypothetical protein MES5069_230034 [Mesorhizobium escarrei]